MTCQAPLLWWGVEGAADGPDEAEQLARDRGDDLRLELAPRGEPAVAVTEAELRLPGDGADRVGQADLAAAERAGTTGAMAIGPGRLEIGRASCRERV